MMRQSFESTCRGRFWRALQVKRDARGQEMESCVQMSGGPAVNQKVRQGSSTSSWDVGNPPTEGVQPGDAKGDQGEKKGPSSSRQGEVPTSNLQKETSTREFFHEKARETEERLFHEGKLPREDQDSKK